MSKTIPVSIEIHKLIKTVSVNYDVTIQEAAARIITAGAHALNIELPNNSTNKDDPFWQIAAMTADDMAKSQTDDIDTIEAAVKKVRQQRDKKKTK